MVSRVSTVSFEGINALPVDVQVMVSPGKKNIHIVGLPDKAVAESRERVQSALHASGLSMPPKKVTVNLAPPHYRKAGSGLDVAIAIAALVAFEVIPADAVKGVAFAGELALDGSIHKAPCGGEGDRQQPC